MSTTGVALVGCGAISDEYLRNLTSFSADLTVVFCADLDQERAAKQAAKYGISAHGTLDQALASSDVDLVVNLTIPAAHVEVTSAAIAKGKHVWSEKPLALDPAGAALLVDQAQAAGVRLGCAPDTVLGAGLQTAQRLIEQGAIGAPLTALALMQVPGPDRWHPDPEFLFRRGAGPLFDIGPYYLSVLSLLFGPVESVAAVGRRSREVRVIGSGPRAGTSFDVEVPTHVSALLSYQNGPAATMVLSFDSPAPRTGFIEVTGTEATMALPDPNRFDGDIRLRRAADEEWTVIPSAGDTQGRGLGVRDMVRALNSGTPHRCTGELGLHVVDTMTAIARSADSGAFEKLATSLAAAQPQPAQPQPA